MTYTFSKKYEVTKKRWVPLFGFWQFFGRSFTSREWLRLGWKFNTIRFRQKCKKSIPSSNLFVGCQFSDFSDFLEGRLPSEDGSDRAENLTRSVSDKVAKKIFLAQTKNLGVTFRAFCSSTVLTFGLFAVRAFWHLGFLQFERFDILTFGLLAVRAFWHLGFLQFERFDIWASCSSSVLTFGRTYDRP